VSDADNVNSNAGLGLAGLIVARSAAPAIDHLRTVQPAAAAALSRALADGTLFTPLSAKPLGKLATELLESLSGSTGDAD
jgi:hypothetical protein